MDGEEAKAERERAITEKLSELGYSEADYPRNEAWSKILDQRTKESRIANILPKLEELLEQDKNDRIAAAFRARVKQRCKEIHVFYETFLRHLYDAGQPLALRPSSTHGPSSLLILPYDPNDSSYPTASSFGRLDVVLNNAGYATLNGVIESISDEHARVQIEHNPPEQGCPILNVSSVGGFISNPTLAYYSASMFAFEGFSEGLNKELDPAWNIRVIAIQPGGVRTEWAKGNMQDVPFPPAYTAPDSVAQRFRDLVKRGGVMSDANKAARALITISKDSEGGEPAAAPPGRRGRAKELDEWKELELSSVADDADPHFFERLQGTV
ncbi:hypothetical protein C8Q80DRAFT_1276259 [Daedaleopsis nitida]|nr:hypothetical protein C8Q80DRAFT_1276259 [Daedaleopsis nitida]